jgi:hypothetical protein
MLRFAEDIVIIAENQEYRQRSPSVVAQVLPEYDMNIIKTKTKIVLCGRAWDGRNTMDTRRRTAHAKITITMKRLLLC